MTPQERDEPHEANVDGFSEFGLGAPGGWSGWIKGKATPAYLARLLVTAILVVASVVGALLLLLNDRSVPLTLGYFIVVLALAAAWHRFGPGTKASRQASN